jgi:hypothetical protein
MNIFKQNLSNMLSILRWIRLKDIMLDKGLVKLRCSEVLLRGKFNCKHHSMVIIKPFQCMKSICFGEDLFTINTDNVGM